MSKVHINWRLGKLFERENFPTFQYSLYTLSLFAATPHACTIKFSIWNDEWKYKHRENAFRLLGYETWKGMKCGGRGRIFVSKMESAHGKLIFTPVIRLPNAKNSEFLSVRERNFAKTWRKILTLSFGRKKTF